MAQYWKTLISSSHTPYPCSAVCSCETPPIAAAGIGKATRIRSGSRPQKHSLKSKSVNKLCCHYKKSTNLKRCLRCNTLYDPLHNSPTACLFHGHITGEQGLFSLAPPHQGIDGEWTDRSGVIVYKWNEIDNRPNTGAANWKKRWSCCSEYNENAPPCRQGCHVSYDDGFTLY